MVLQGPLLQGFEDWARCLGRWVVGNRHHHIASPADGVHIASQGTDIAQAACFEVGATHHGTAIFEGSVDAAQRQRGDEIWHQRGAVSGLQQARQCLGRDAAAARQARAVVHQR